MSETMKLSISVPTSGRVPMGFAYSLAGLVGYIAANGIKTRPEMTVEAHLDVNESSVIHANREGLVARAIERGDTHLLFLDDDMVFEPRILDVIAGRRHPIVAVNYLIKSADPVFVAVGLDGQRIATTEGSTGIVPIAYTGFGVSLFDLDVFKRTPQPWFCPEWSATEKSYTTEDNPCYRKLREAGFTAYLDHDASRLVSHVGAKGWNWSEWKAKVN